MRPRVHFMLVRLTNHPLSPAVVKMFESCLSALVEAINVQRRGNVSKIRVGASSSVFDCHDWTLPVDGILSWGPFFGISFLREASLSPPVFAHSGF